MEACCLAVSMKLQSSVVSTDMHTECIYTQQFMKGALYLYVCVVHEYTIA